jgi:hypothetical protein
MKKLIILTLTVLMTVSIASFAVAAGNGAGLLNSPHDFSATIPALGGEICRICHSPHDHHVAGQNYLNGLLWNKTQSTATYTMYDQAAWPTYSSLDGTVSAQPDGTAKLCLSCHDGTVAVDSFENHAPAGFTLPQYAEIPGFADGANRDLRGTHPISITYEVLDNNKVQCSSCHDVHDAPIESVAGTPLLRVTNAGSAICLACHIK